MNLHSLTNFLYQRIGKMLKYIFLFGLGRIREFFSRTGAHRNDEFLCSTKKKLFPQSYLFGTFRSAQRRFGFDRNR